MLWATRQIFYLPRHRYSLHLLTLVKHHTANEKRKSYSRFACCLYSLLRTLMISAELNRDRSAQLIYHSLLIRTNQRWCVCHEPERKINNCLRKTIGLLSRWWLRWKRDAWSDWPTTLVQDVHLCIISIMIFLVLHSCRSDRFHLNANDWQFPSHTSSYGEAYHTKSLIPLSSHCGPKQKNQLSEDIPSSVARP